MIDFVEIHVHRPNMSIISEKLPEITTNARNHNKIYKSTKGQYGNLKIVATSYGLVIRGSIHKYFNEKIKSGERENISRIEFTQLVSIFNHLAEEFDFSLEEAELKILEFGFNLRMRKNAAEYLQSIHSILGQNGITYYFSTIFSNNSLFMKYSEGEGIIRKLYDKTRDRNIDFKFRRKSKKLLRLELRVNQYSRFLKFPSTVSELMNTVNLLRLAGHLHDFVGQLTISDTLDLNQALLNPTPNNIIKHLLLTYTDQSSINLILKTSQIPQKQKRATINSLRKFHQSFPNTKSQLDGNIKEEIAESLEREVSFFFDNV